MMTFLKWVWYTKVGKLVVLTPISITFLVLAAYHESMWMYIASAIFGIFPAGIILAGFGYAYVVLPCTKIRDWFKKRKKQ